MTNEALARIKAACLLSVDEYDNKDAKDILAIIVRLEIAERVCDAAERDQLSHFEAGMGWKSTEDTHVALIEWHKEIEHD